MSKPFVNWTARCYPNGFLSSAVLLVAATAAFLTLLSPLAFWLQGVEGFFTAFTAAMICLLSGITALAASHLPVFKQQPLAGMLFAMALRMLPPLVACLRLARYETGTGTGTEHLSFVSYLIMFYLLTLTAETFLSLQLIKNITR